MQSYLWHLYPLYRSWDLFGNVVICFSVKIRLFAIFLSFTQSTGTTWGWMKHWGQWLWVFGERSWRITRSMARNTITESSSEPARWGLRSLKFFLPVPSSLWMQIGSILSLRVAFQQPAVGEIQVWRPPPSYITCSEAQLTSCQCLAQIMLCPNCPITSLPLNHMELLTAALDGLMELVSLY